MEYQQGRCWGRGAWTHDQRSHDGAFDKLPGEHVRMGTQCPFAQGPHPSNMAALGPAICQQKVCDLRVVTCECSVLPSWPWAQIQGALHEHLGEKEWPAPVRGTLRVELARVQGSALYSWILQVQVEYLDGALTRDACLACLPPAGPPLVSSPGLVL